MKRKYTASLPPGLAPPPSRAERACIESGKISRPQALVIIQVFV